MRVWVFAAAAAALLFATQFRVGMASGDGGDGRYEGISASANAVWVLDTRQGSVRKCTQEFADRAPACSAFSN